MPRALKLLVWIAIAAVGALAFGTIALHRGESISALWLVVAALCTYALGYRFYSAVVAAKVLAINTILLGVVALVVVNALKSSPWGTFTIAMTIPIALLMGVYLRVFRPGRVLETSVIGFVLVLAAIFGGQWIAQTPALAHAFTL